MKLLAVCIVTTLFPFMKAQAFPFPSEIESQIQSEKSNLKLPTPEQADAAQAEELANDPEHECEIGKDFLEVDSKYVDCFDCMFPPEWLNEVKSQLDGEEEGEENPAMSSLETTDIVDFVKATTAGKISASMTYPVVGGAKFLSGLGDPRSGGRRHKGVDLGAKMGTPVVAVWPGRVVRSGRSGLGGWAVRIEHPNGFWTYYAHLKNAPSVREGDLVSAGKRVGLVGMSGNARGTTPHLHFEVHAGKQLKNPLAYLGGKSMSTLAYAPNAAASDEEQRRIDQADSARNSFNSVLRDSPSQKKSKRLLSLQDQEILPRQKAEAHTYENLPGVKTYGY